MIKALIAEKEASFASALEHFANEAAKIRTGRANPGLVENLIVDYYGVKTPLKQMASIVIPEARQIMIQPWDKGSLVMIEAAIRESDLGLNPGNDGVAIRITLPALTEDRRHELVKSLNSRAEEGRIAIRTIREDIWKALQDNERAGDISEDDKFQGKDELQKVVDGYNQKLEAIRKKKEEEILTV
ncbi:MAG: ribosome recycling factor [Candidatus Moranbacteria bacterium RIFCSPHIGHO2_12_FULL_54_9]|nr:MAG: ribosome recycling factor [Candidatus Moranbacteria bacterium RIFCSPHIGHO2_01_FULL_54_31]OGI26259.1 MAG: ribosome recycling factor [Candidatus Moranbacteria bacterium RIFCSPHIGHO2_12_FULL_54_9]